MRDVASGVEGELMAVVNENVSAVAAREYWVDLAYIRAASGREFSTSIDNVEEAPEPSGRPLSKDRDPRPGSLREPRTARGRHGDRSA
ncbi:hypothetical protein [Streptomyces vinaceus]|uniref:hypothetical protein n=1 Tax=Streptomyces vinaceus TaxID=1960 RepID=UPI0038084A59